VLRMDVPSELLSTSTGNRYLITLRYSLNMCLWSFRSRLFEV
jgi:hypothetical protein